MQSLLVYEEAMYPVCTDAPQYVILRADEYSMTQALVVSRLLDLFARLLRQTQLILVLNVSTRSVQNIIFVLSK